MSTKIFNSNETLEMCDVTVTQEGGVTIKTKSYHTAELERLGKPEKTIRGRMKMVEKDLVFDPYAEGTRKPTYKKQVVVGSTTLAVTEDKVKVSFLVPRHLRKDIMVMYIQSEMDEVKRRLVEDVYDMLVKASKENDNADAKRASVATTEALALQRSGACDLNRHPDGKVNVNVNVNVEKKGGAA